jgi:hypothetical protein
VGQITELLARARRGDRRAEGELAPLIYDAVRKLAAHCMRGRRRDHTLQPTTLARETYLRLTGKVQDEWQNRARVLAVASQTMLGEIFGTAE